MSDTAAALRAAKEVQADTLAPELFRQAREAFFIAKREYQLKNFEEARGHAERARRYAEEAEYEAIQSGASRTAAPPDPLSEPEGPTKPTTRPPGPTGQEGKPEGTYVETLEEQERKKTETLQSKPLETEPPASPPSGPGAPSGP